MSDTAVKLALAAQALAAAERDPEAPLVVDVDQRKAPAPETDEGLTPQPKTSPSAPRAPPPGRILIDRETLLNKLAVSDATLRRKMDLGILPRPYEIGSAYCLRWDLGEVEAAIMGLRRSGENDAGGEPTQSVQPGNSPPAT